MWRIPSLVSSSLLDWLSTDRPRSCRNAYQFRSLRSGPMFPASRVLGYRPRHRHHVIDADLSSIDFAEESRASFILLLDPHRAAPVHRHVPDLLSSEHLVLDLGVRVLRQHPHSVGIVQQDERLCPFLKESHSDSPRNQLRSYARLIPCLASSLLAMARSLPLTFCSSSS